jgi:hypothetical protein
VLATIADIVGRPLPVRRLTLLLESYRKTGRSR